MLRAAKELRGRDPEWLGPEEADARLRPQRTPDSRRKLQREALDEAIPDGFVDRCMEIVLASAMRPSQKLAALSLLQRACETSLELEAVGRDATLVHDELLLHRAFSLLPHSADLEADTAWYFATVPAPEVAVIVESDAGRIAHRAIERGLLPNCYFGLRGTALRDLIERSLIMCDIAATTLDRRGVEVRRLDASGEALANARRLHEHILQLQQSRESLAI